MKRMWWVAAAAVVSLAPMSACLTPDNGGGGGGGGGGGPVAFQTGFAFMRSDDIYVADQSDFSAPNKLTSTGSNKHPSLSGDGKQVVFVHADPAGNQIQTVATDGSGAPRTVYTADATQKNFRTPVFSPDGTRIVFAFDTGTGSNSQLGVVNSDGSGFAPLTSATFSYAAPCFYKDGQNVLAIAGSSSTSYTQVQKVNVTTGTTATVANTLDPRVLSIANRAVLSPDETLIAFDGFLVANPSASRIFVMGLANGTYNGTTTQMTDYPGDASAQDSFPTWTTTTDVGFSSNTGGADQVYVLPASSNMTSGGLKLPSALQPWFGGVNGPTT